MVRPGQGVLLLTVVDRMLMARYWHTWVLVRRRMGGAPLVTYHYPGSVRGQSRSEARRRRPVFGSELGTPTVLRGLSCGWCWSRGPQAAVVDRLLRHA